MTDWILWVDESGDFSDDTQYASVTGVLVRVGVVGFSKIKLRRLFIEACGHVPWPVHRKLVNASVMHGVWAVWTADRDGSILDRRVRAVVEAIQRAAPREYERVVKRLGQDLEPQYRDVTALEGALRRLAPWQRRLLERKRLQCWGDVVGGVGAALRLGAGDRGQSAADSVWLVAAGESENGDAIAAGPLQDRYLHLLGCVAQRAADVLLSRGGVNRIGAYVATRWCLDAQAGETRALSTHVVDRAFAWGLGAPDRLVLGEGGARVEVACQQVLAYGAKAPPGLVVADWGANAFGWASARQRPLGRVSELLDDSVGLPVSRGALPTIAATGLPWSSLREADAGNAGGAAGSRRRGRPWAWEQAEAWRGSRPGCGEVGRR